MNDLESRDQIIADLSERLDRGETVIMELDKALAESLHRLVLRAETAEAEVDRLKDNYAALKDEFNRGAALAQQHCPKPRLGHSVFEGIPLLAAEVERLNGEVGLLKESTRRLPELLWKTARYTAICDLLIRPRGEDVVEMVECIKKEWHELRAHTWEQERKAVVAWLVDRGDRWYSSPFNDAKRLECGEHWLEGEKA